MPLEIIRTTRFDHCLGKLKGISARQIISKRMKRLADGKFGASRSLGHGLSELKIDFGPGYRLYFTRRGDTIVWLLCGGDKSTQAADIALARHLSATIAGGDDGV